MKLLNSIGSLIAPAHRVLVGTLCAFVVCGTATAAPVITAQPSKDIVFIGDAANFSVVATGSGTLSYQWFRNGAPVGGATSDVVAFTTLADDDGALYSVEVTDSVGTTTSDTAELIIDFGMAGTAHTNQIIAITDSWRYHVSGTDLGTAWRESGYSDASWASGGGLLYVESSTLPAPKTTALPLSDGSLPTTCYFRASFNYNLADAYSVEFIANTVVDDGIVIYLNGSEVLRDGLNTATIEYSTLADNVNNAVYKGPFTLDAASLLDGANLIAAEVHQSSAGSSDIVMGMTLDAIWTERVSDTDEPVVEKLSPSEGLIVIRLKEIEVTFSEGVQGVDAEDLLINGVAATNVTELSKSLYRFEFPEPAEGNVSVSWAEGHGIVDRSAGEHAFAGSDFNYQYEPLLYENLALFKRSYLLLSSDSQAPASNVNDGNLSTEAIITQSDCYWEVDLGDTYALYSVHAVSASGIGDRLTNTVCRLYDENHDSVFEKNMTGEDPEFNADLNGPHFARYVRVGLEDKIHSTGPTGTREWKIGFAEVEVFGRPASEVGIQSFSVSDTTVSSGQAVTMNWSVEDVHHVAMHPSIGSVDSHTDANGSGSLTHAITQSTEFILVATNDAGVFSRAVAVEVNGGSLPVVISEIVADSKYSLEDGYGDASDWIELRNTGNSAVDLTGWGLSDNPEKPMKFTFPSTSIAPHETLIVFASNRDVVLDPTGMLHADFALGKNGETVQLTTADGTTVIDSVTYPELDTDLAYGRALDGGWTFMEPSPDAANTGDTYEGWLKDLDWSHARGFYETNFTLTVTSENIDDTILYSLDASEPSIPYTGGISITGTETVRIQAVRPGYKPARIQTKTFIFVDDVITSSVMDTGITQDPAYASRMKPGLLAIPTISIVLPTTEDLERAIIYDEQAGSIEIIWPNGEYSPVQEDCGISRFGGAYGGISSEGIYAKRAISLSFRREYGNGKLEAPLFNGFDRGVLARKSFDKLHLRGGNHDTSQRGFSMSDRFIQDSYLDMGSLNPHGRFVHVYLNGVYWGNYNCKEVLNESFLADYLGGESEDYVSVKGNANNQSNFVTGVGDPPNPEPWERVRALRNSFDAVSPYLDVSHFIDFMLLWGYGNSESEFRACGPREAGSGHKFWINDPDGFLRDISSDRISSSNGPGFIWTALMGENHPDFKMLLADRIYKHFFNDGAMMPANCDARLVARMDEIRDSYLAESARWGFLSPANWESKGATVRSDMFPYRAAEMVSHARSNGYFPDFDPPTFSQYGGPVLNGYQPMLSSSAGTIYYTLDGTDPRLPGGEISPYALVWSPGAVTITDDLVIMTRVRASDGTWSALAEPRYTLASRRAPVAGDLLITEISYNPAGDDAYEFIEIWNAGTDYLDLSNSSVNGGVRYVFPEATSLDPGEFIVVVEDAVAFADRYQTPVSPWYWDGVVVAGEWVGGLSDDGETLSLNAADDSLISAVSYRIDGEWPERANGDGSTLQLIAAAEVPTDAAARTAYLADARNWISSSLYHGSPGRFETVANGVVINEILSHTDVGVDWIEFWNTTDIEVDLSGFAITDDLSWPDRYILPVGAVIPEGGYLTVSAADLGFGFSELGAEASLLQLSGSDIIRFVDRVRFPAVQREEPFGRYIRSDGEIDFTELIDVTPLASNEAPRVGPVVISEIMFAPAPGDPEYIEIVNISDTSVALYDIAIPTNTWGFGGVGDFAFPEATVLEPSKTAILCSTNPAVFRARYGLAPDALVFGPWTGGLALEGEKLRLLSPGDPEPDGSVPMYRADHVTYRTNDAWAVANTGGISLERKQLTGYGNDPVNWSASIAGGTPGFVLFDTYPMGTTIQFSGDYPTIAFEAFPGQSYEVRYTDSLNIQNWQTLTNIPSAITGRIEVMDPAPAHSTRYYRIIWN
ncbi:lamin tail domain-containing protein [Pontiellaceae bacterium B1224]|nr:lamin tail domain-containing protein [Pontiellaceae bacterium B1224]